MRIFKNKENLLILVLSLVLVTTLTIGMVRAYLYTASNVAYSNLNVPGSNTQKTIEEMYKKACPSNAICEFKKSWSNVSVGDYVQMTPNPGTLDSQDRYPTDPSKTGYSSVQYVYPKQLKLWRVIRKNSDGSIEMISEYSSSINIGFGGATGYANFVGYLNTLAKQYENPTYTSGSRHMGYDGQTEILTNTKAFDGTWDVVNDGAPWTCSTYNSSISSCNPKPNDNESLGGGDMLYKSDVDLVRNVYGNIKAKKCENIDCDSVSSLDSCYWLAGRYYNGSNDSVNFYFHGSRACGYTTFSNTYFVKYENGNWNNGTDYYPLRPIITLKSGLNVSDALGTKEFPFILE